jgi:hypothetical protein
MRPIVGAPRCPQRRQGGVRRRRATALRLDLS